MNELRPIGKRQTLPELMNAVKTQGWIFESVIEKLIVAGCILWTAFSIGKLIVGFF